MKKEDKCSKKGKSLWPKLFKRLSKFALDKKDSYPLYEVKAKEARGKDGKIKWSSWKEILK